MLLTNQGNNGGNGTTAGDNSGGGGGGAGDSVLVLMVHLTLVDLVEMENQFQNLQHLLFHQLFQGIHIPVLVGHQ